MDKRLKEINELQATITEMDRHIVETEQQLNRFKNIRQQMFVKLISYKYALDLEE